MNQIEEAVRTLFVLASIGFIFVLGGRILERVRLQL